MAELTSLPNERLTARLRSELLPWRGMRITAFTELTQPVRSS